MQAPTTLQNDTGQDNSDAVAGGYDNQTKMKVGRGKKKPKD